MLSASAKPSAARVCTGSAFSPKAGRMRQSGRHARPGEGPAAQIDSPAWRAAAAGSEQDQRGGVRGEASTDRECKGLGLTERKGRDNGVAQTAHEPRPFYDRFQDRTPRLQLRLEDRGFVRPRYWRQARGARLPVRRSRAPGLPDLRRDPRVRSGQRAVRQNALRHDPLGARRAELAHASVRCRRPARCTPSAPFAASTT